MSKVKTAFITGANKGIGLETARQLANRGYCVFVGSRNIAKDEVAAAHLHQQTMARVETIQIDVSDESSVASAFEKLRLRTNHLDVLINNAGIRGDVPQNASSLALDVIREVFDTNFFGAINVTQTFLPLLKRSSAPRIVNVSSDLASLTRHTDPRWAYYRFRPAAYAPSKCALNAFTVMLAKELAGTNFKVNAVNPVTPPLNSTTTRATKVSKKQPALSFSTPRSEKMAPAENSSATMAKRDGNSWPRATETHLRTTSK